MTLAPKLLLDHQFNITEMNGPSTLRYYFLTLLAALWDQEEGFSGKRPLGNSGWEGQLEDDMTEAGLLEDISSFDKFIIKCIWAML